VIANHRISAADPLQFLLWRQSDVLTRQQALRHLCPSAIEHRLACGRWRQAHHGVYIAHDGPVTGQQLLWVAYLASGRGAYLAGATAAASCGLRGYGGGAIHVLIPARRQERTPPRGVVVHRTRRMTPDEVNPLGTPPHTTAARSLVDAAQWAASDQRAWAIIAAGYQQRLVLAGEIEGILARLTHARRRRLILEAAAEASGGAHSLPEAHLLRYLRRARLPLPRLQVRREDASGAVRYLDGYYERWGVHLEVDGGQHLEASAYWQDMRRQNELWITGDRVLRFPSWAIRHQPAEVVRQVRAALLAAGWRPS
jgi:very-short-patch-repair endonuclease